VLDLDATIAASYGGSGTKWANLEPTPADSSAQTAYDFTNVGFTFTGSAGSAAAYWLSDGNDYMDIAAGNTTFMKDLHKTTDWTLAFVFLHEQKTGLSVQRFFTTTNANNAQGIIALAGESLADFSLLQRGTSATAQAIGTADNLVDGTTYVVIMSHSESNNNTKVWINTTTATDWAHNFAAASADATTNARIGALGNGNDALSNGTRVYAFSMFNEYFDDTKAATVIAEYEARHARDYTP
jgi:hypothetical protein